MISKRIGVYVCGIIKLYPSNSNELAFESKITINFMLNNTDMTRTFGELKRFLWNVKDLSTTYWSFKQHLTQRK